MLRSAYRFEVMLITATSNGATTKILGNPAMSEHPRRLKIWVAQTIL